MILGQPWLYWSAAAFAFVLVCAPCLAWLAHWLERRADERDREAWARVNGSVKR